MPGTVGLGGHFLESGGRAVVPVGAHFVPVEGPDWPWRVGPEAFDRAFRDMAALGLNAVRVDLLWEAIEPKAGTYDEAHLRQLDAVLEAARRHGLWLHPALFIGGEVGDAYWDVPWREGRHAHADPEMRELQVRHAGMLAERWRGDPSLLAWDLTDEPPFWIFPETTDEAARAWTGEIGGALRAADPSHLVTVGTSGQELHWGPFRADVIAEYLDFACVHPYPIYQAELYPDALLSPRMTLAAAFETALAAGAGRPVMVHEYGASSAQFDPELLGSYDRLLTWSSFGRGAIGYFAWCWTDADPAAYRRAPYVRSPHETQFGVTDWKGGLRPRGRVLREVGATLGKLDVGAYAGLGPAPATAAIPVPHEYVRPFDPAAFGLQDAPAGRYVPAESSWRPEKDPGTLVRGWLNAFVLACRAGLTVSFPREGLDDEWPSAPVLLMPAPLASTSQSLWHVKTSFWRGARAFFARGGILYVSVSSDVAIPEMEEVAGCRVADRARADRPPVLRFVARWGPFSPGDEVELPLGDGTLGTRGARLILAGGDAIAVDADGDAALVSARRGTGWAVTCALPIELLLAGVPDAHGPADRTWGIYAGIRSLAGIDEEPRVDHPDVTTGMLLGSAGGLATVTNHGPTTVETSVRLPAGATSADLADAGGSTPLPLEDGEGTLLLDPFGSALVAWRGKGG